MNGRLLVFLIFGVSLVFGLLFAREMRLARDLPRTKFDKKLKILTYSTFVGASGPGGEILDRFKAARGCELEVVVVSDAGLLLPRLKLLHDVDLVIGLDQFTLGQARALGEWRDLEISREGWTTDLPLANDKKFIPFDWSPLTFLYREGTPAPRSFNELTDPKFKNAFALQDPRTSSPGLDFLVWTDAVEGARAGEFLKRFKNNVQSVSPNWVYSYGLFKDRKAQFVFTYLTSLAFHWGTEKDPSYRAVEFPEGHPVQTEFMAVPKTCLECALAADLVAEYLKPDAQKIVMTKNYMRPVVAAAEAGTIYEKLPRLKILPLLPPLQPDFENWDEAFPR